MTRYLPNRKEEFDLRAHVESSGHSIDTCPFVILTEKMCKGHLVKMGGKIKSWKKRWFVFDRLKRNFAYYVGEDTAVIRGDVCSFINWAFFTQTPEDRYHGRAPKMTHLHTIIITHRYKLEESQHFRTSSFVIIHFSKEEKPALIPFKANPSHDPVPLWTLIYLMV